MLFWDANLGLRLVTKRTVRVSSRSRRDSVVGRVETVRMVGCAEVSARLKLRFLFSLVFIFSSLSLSKSGLLGFSFRFRSLDLDLSLWFQSISDVVVLGYPCLCASDGFVLHPLSHLMFVI